MNRNDIKMIQESCEVIKGSLSLWTKKCTALLNTVNQIDGLNKAKMELFLLTDDVQSDLLEALEGRIMDELQSLANALHTLETILEALQEKQQVVEKAFNEADERNAVLFCRDCSVLSSLCSSLVLLIPMKKVPIRKATLRDLESFQSFKDINEETKIIEIQIELLFNYWNEDPDSVP